MEEDKFVFKQSTMPALSLKQVKDIYNDILSTNSFLRADLAIINSREMPIYKQLLSDRVDKYMKRINGDITCEICGAPYHLHPFDTEVLDFWPDYFLHKLCNGILGKT